MWCHLFYKKQLFNIDYTFKLYTIIQDMWKMYAELLSAKSYKNRKMKLFGRI